MKSIHQRLDRIIPRHPLFVWCVARGLKINFRKFGVALAPVVGLVKEED